jgi:hypothetical protein
VPKAARFAWQHDVQFETPEVLRLFDNASDGTKIIHSRSRILWLSIDEPRRRRRPEAPPPAPDKVTEAAMGNAQPLPNGNVFVGWGTAKRISEFAPDGRLLFDASLPEVTYRAYRKTATWPALDHSSTPWYRRHLRSSIVHLLFRGRLWT